MRRFSPLVPVFIYALTFTLSQPAQAEPRPEGHYEGAVSRFGAVQHLEVDFSGPNDTLSAVYSIPELGLFNEPAKDVTIAAERLTLRIWHGLFDCRFFPELKEITGINEDWKPPVSIHLKKVVPIPDVYTRPVTFRSGELRLSGTCLTPAGPGPFPAAVIIHGSGEQSRADWMYRGFGYALARRGIAALVYDKRGVGQSEGDFATATFDDLALDAARGARFLAEQTRIDPEQIGYLGISQGGWIQLLAAQHPPQPAFHVMVVGPAVSVWTQEEHRVEYSMRADGYSETDIEQALDHARLMFEAAIDRTRWEALLKSNETVAAGKWKDYVNLVTTPTELDEWLRDRFDPAELLQKTTVPTLSIFAANDVLVPPTENADLMRGYLEAAGNPDFRIEVIDGVNHELMTYHSLVGDRWEWPAAFWRWNRRPPELYELIIGWVKAHAPPAR